MKMRLHSLISCRCFWSVPWGPSAVTACFPVFWQESYKATANGTRWGRQTEPGQIASSADDAHMTMQECRHCCSKVAGTAACNSLPSQYSLPSAGCYLNPSPPTSCKPSPSTLVQPVPVCNAQSTSFPTAGTSSRLLHTTQARLTTRACCR